jgi:tetratricopeptide (TPR) repeat protein
MAESGDKPQRLKQRGVRASRIKLERALAESDLEKKTQAALAERIADIEQLDAAPKDLVSKVFRERYVDPQTLQRVARALGVDAATLYLEAQHASSGDVAAQHSGDAVAPAALTSISRRARLQIAASFAGAFVLFVLFTALAIRPAGPWCGLREAATRPHAQEGTLGLTVARFANDPENRAQQFIVSALASDETLAPFTSIIATCARPGWSGPGEIRRKILNIRKSGQKKLDKSGAHLLLWGELAGDDIIVRFISTRRDVSALAVEITGRPLGVDEANLELRLPLGRPGEALADLKRLALELIEPGDGKEARLREFAIHSFRSSADWLRAAIVSQRNLRRTVDPAIEPQRWAAINMQLCHDLRLLGDYEADEGRYTQALEACNEALKVRPRERFPHDWASTEINRASSLIRLHYFSTDREGALDNLQNAEKALASVVEASDSRSSPQLRITAQRNLGVVYLRLGEQTDGAASSQNFEKGLALLRAALDAQDPAYQPLDWAITQQNICLALYQYGARIGGDGAAFVEEARTRCADAVNRLSPDNSPLDWAMAQNNLAAATAVLAQLRNDADGLSEAIDGFAAAQSVYTRDRLPGNWAEVELNLGELHCNLAVMKRDPALFDTATAHLDAALEVFIANGNARYQRYTEKLEASVDACAPSNIAECVCGG